MYIVTLMGKNLFKSHTWLTKQKALDFVKFSFNKQEHRDKIQVMTRDEFEKLNHLTDKL